MSDKQPKRKPRPGVDPYGRTPLHYAASEGATDVVRDLVRAGMDVRAPDDNGWTPLHFAAQKAAAEAAVVLLEAGALVDAQDHHGNTPLSSAVFNCDGNGELKAVLRRHGADPRIENHYGVTPLSLARMIATVDVARYFADLPV